MQFGSSRTGVAGRVVPGADLATVLTPSMTEGGKKKKKKGGKKHKKKVKATAVVTKVVENEERLEAEGDEPSLEIDDAATEKTVVSSLATSHA